MGKIHDRIKARAEKQRNATVDTRTLSRIAGMSTRQRNDTAERLSALITKIVDADNLDTGARHELMSDLANEAKALGLKGCWNLLCNRTQCLRPDATWYNRGSHAFYCAECAHMLNNDRFNGRDAERLFGPGEKLCIEVMTASQAENLHVSA
jgi:hypothetical protein